MYVRALWTAPSSTALLPDHALLAAKAHSPSIIASSSQVHGKVERGEPRDSNTSSTT